MTVREILKMGDPRLLRIAEPVHRRAVPKVDQPPWGAASAASVGAPVTRFDTPELHKLLVDMADTMFAANGAGLAAPQIGENLQVVIFGFDHNDRYPDAPPVPRTILINPTITPLSPEEEDGWEGCLSVPGLRGVVPRYARIRYQGFDQTGRAIDREADGFHARVVQHEVDHLIGRLYPTRMRDLTKLGFTSVLFPDLDASAGDD